MDWKEYRQIWSRRATISMRNPFGLPTRAEREYAEPERLADVMGLIQVLALDEKSGRTEDGLTNELQGGPRSSSTWVKLARDHPEFFRVSQKQSVFLIARYVTPDRTLTPEFTSGLLQAAIDIHDRQVRRCERWTYLVPIWVALIAGVVSVFVVLFRWQTGGCP